MKRFMRRLARKFLGRSYLIPGYVLAAKLAILGGSFAGAQAFGMFVLAMAIGGLACEASVEHLRPCRGRRGMR